MTSRFPLVDLDDWTGAGHRSIALDDLECLVALDVLRAWNVHGDDDALTLLIEPLNVGNQYHALSVAVLGSYLGNFAGGDLDEPVTETHAALFTSDGSGLGPLAALNQDGSVNSAENPASAGSVVSVFGTGFGVMAPAALDGATPCKAVSKPVPVFSFAMFGDSAVPAFSAPATVEYIGNAPCLVQDAVQINLHLPDTVKPFNGVITLSTFGGIGSGTIAVR